MAYVKLFESILASTIWAEPTDTRIVWVTMLAMADRDGNVQASVPGLAHFARVSEEACKEALASFMRPDKNSRTKTNEGRRIVEVDGGWLVLNYEEYRDRLDYEEKKEKDRLRQQRKRERDAAKVSRQPVTQCHAGHAESQKVASHSHSDSHSHPQSQVQKKTPRAGALGVYEEGFQAFWQAYGHKIGKHAAEKAWASLKPTGDTLEAIVAKARATSDANPSREFYKHPATWLNGRHWQDEVIPNRSAPINANGRTVVAASKQHIPNMPLGAASCQCPGCVDYRNRRAAQ